MLDLEFCLLLNLKIFFKTRLSFKYYMDNRPSIKLLHIFLELEAV